MRKFAIRVPTTRYLKKYLSRHYGHPIPINNFNPFGVMVIALMQKKSVTGLDIVKKDTRFLEYNDFIMGVGSFNLHRTAGVRLDDDAIIQINRFFEASFEETLYQFVRFNLTTHPRFPRYDQALYKFAFRYGIEFDEDISYDGLKKIEYRYRKKIEKLMPSFVPQELYNSKQGEMFE